MTEFQINDPSLESQWRALILFGKNSATYKFAFAKSLLELIEKETTSISLKELAKPFSRNITEHLKSSDKQGNSNSSTFLNVCRDYNNEIIDEAQLLKQTERLGFVNVVDAFQNVNGGQIPNLFYEKDYSRGDKRIVITDDLIRLKESFHFQNFENETEARWKLVETAWNLKINPNLLEVKYDQDASLFFLENDFMKRVDITSVRDSLNGYQKGKCFYCYKAITIVSGDNDLADVDHFIPFVAQTAVNTINGVWNLVLSCSDCNRGVGGKFSQLPTLKLLKRLHKRNEYLILSYLPLKETLIRQTGQSEALRKIYLQNQYDKAKGILIHTWEPEP